MTKLRFTIGTDGTITAMHVDKSASDEPLNQAAREAITGAGKFPALPKQFHGPGMELRLDFLLNEAAGIPSTATRF